MTRIHLGLGFPSAMDEGFSAFGGAEHVAAIEDGSLNSLSTVVATPCVGLVRHHHFLSIKYYSQGHIKVTVKLGLISYTL